MVGMAAYGALGAACQHRHGRRRGQFARLAAAVADHPDRPRQVVLGRAVSGSVTVLPAILAVLRPAALVNGVRLARLAVGGLVLLLWLGALPFTLLGHRQRLPAVRPERPESSTWAPLWASAVIGGLWFPIEAVPRLAAVPRRVHPGPPVRRTGLGDHRRPCPGARRPSRVLLGWLAAVRLVRRDVVPSVGEDVDGSDMPDDWRERNGRAAGYARSRPATARRDRSPCCRGCCWAWAPSPTSSRARPRTPGSAALGLLAFNSLYIPVVFRAFDPVRRSSPSTWWSLGGMAVITFGLASPTAAAGCCSSRCLGLACGTVLRGRVARRWSGRAADARGRGRGGGGTAAGTRSQSRTGRSSRGW